MRGGITVALVTLALAVSAPAQEACLTGPSTLADQRALATLRASTEANCPCDSYGTTGRRDFRRCARLETRAALDAGTIRRECFKTAKKLYKDATCGSNRVACGGYDADDAEIRCRLAAPTGRNQCDGRPGRLETPCVEQTHCADVIDWTASTCVDPRQRGPYGVGVRTIQYVKDSVASPGTPRPLDTVIWYPSTVSEPITANYGAVIDAPFDGSGGPYPLLLFSHGSCGLTLQSIFLTPLLASYGFIVAAVPHPGNTIAEFPNCGLPAAQASSLQERPNDVIFVTDQLLAANTDNTSFLFGAIDPDRLGIFGHSFGGLTTYVVATQDPRFKVAIPLAPAALFNPTLNVPSLTMMGQVDGRVNNAQTRAAYDRSVSPKIAVEIQHAGHYAFSDGCFPSADCSPPTTLTQDEAHAHVLRWVLPFLERYLVGDESYEPFLVSTPPGVAVVQER